MSLYTFVALATIVTTVKAQAVQVNTPTAVQACLPVKLTWSGSSGPFFVSLIPGGQPSAAPLKDFGQQTGDSLVWQVDQAPGTSLTVQIRDSQGNLNYSDKFNVQPNPQCPSGTSTATAPVSTSTSSATPGGSSPPSSGNKNTSNTPSTPGGTSSSTPNTTNSSSHPTTSGSTSVPTTGTSSNAANTTTAGSEAKNAAGRVTPGLLAIGFSVALAIFA